MERINGYDNYKLATPDWYDEAGNWCDRCDAVINTDDMFETACSCDPDALCSECGEELPEVDDAHCTECCECDTCMSVWHKIEDIHELTGKWMDMPVITGEKVH